MNDMENMENTNTLIAKIIQQLKKLNPNIQASSASDEEINKIKELFPESPESLFQLLRQCNGTWNYPFFPTALELMSAEQMINGFGTADEAIEDLEDTVDIDEFEEFDDAIKPLFFNPQQLILANCNYDCFWLIDFDPAPNGKMGQIIYQDVESGILKVIASSLDELLMAYSKDLNADLFTFDEVDNSISLKSGKDWEIKAAY